MENLHQNSIEQKSEIINEIITDFSKKSLKSLKLEQTKLNYLCINFDPYDNLDMPTEIENIINEYKLNSFLNNPFEFTNVLLQILDKLEQAIKSKQN